MSETEPGITAPEKGNECPGRSPGGWHCCLPAGHEGNHIGTTQDFGTLHQWATEGEK